MKSSGMVLMIFLRKGCKSCIHTSSYLTLLPSAFLPHFSSHSSVFKPVYTHPPLLVKLCAGTVGYLKMSARLWQVWSSLGSQLDKPSGKKGLSTHPHALSSQALAVKTLETLPAKAWHCHPYFTGTTLNDGIVCLALCRGGEWSRFQNEGLGHPDSKVSHQGLSLKQVEVGHELQLGTGTGCSQLEAWIPMSETGSSHSNGNATSFLRSVTQQYGGESTTALKTCCIHFHVSYWKCLWYHGSQAFDRVSGDFPHGDVVLELKPWKHHCVCVFPHCPLHYSQRMVDFKAAVHGVAKSRTQLSAWAHTHAHTRACTH